MEKKHLIIIDSNSVIHRAYHALPPLTTKKGELINAIYGYLLVFLKIIKDFNPNYLVATFDLPGPTFRHEKFKEYKATRPKTAEGISEQIPKIKEILKKMNVSIFEKQGFEADDIIGTIAKQTANFSKEEKIETIIISGDLDILQLVNDKTKVFHLRKGVKDTVLYDENLVKEKYQGLTPQQLIDFKSLRGDPSDNIPGIRGIGEKIAKSLILKFNSLKNLYKEIEENSEKAKTIKLKLKDLLVKNKDQAFLSKELVLIEKNVPIDFNLNNCQWKKLDKEKTKEIFEKFEFYSLIKRLSEI